MTDEEVRAHLLAEVEKVMKARLAAKPMDQAMTLSDMEQWVLRTGQEVQARLMQALAQASQALRPAKETDRSWRSAQS